MKSMMEVCLRLPAIFYDEDDDDDIQEHGDECYDKQLDTDQLSDDQYKTKQFTVNRSIQSRLLPRKS